MVKPLGIVDPFAEGGYSLPVSTASKFLRAEAFTGASGDVGESMRGAAILPCVTSPSLIPCHFFLVAVFDSRGNRKAHIQFSFMELDASNDLVRHESATFDFKTDSFTLDEAASSLVWAGGVTGGGTPGEMARLQNMHVQLQ